MRCDAEDGRMRVAVILIAVLLTGCAPMQRVIVLSPPSGYLEPCELPALPETNPELSQALVAAWRCAEAGNADKRRIQEWAKDREERFK